VRPPGGICHTQDLPFFFQNPWWLSQTMLPFTASQSLVLDTMRAALHAFVHGNSPWPATTSITTNIFSFKNGSIGSFHRTAQCDWIGAPSSETKAPITGTQVPCIGVALYPLLFLHLALVIISTCL
jgi:carboxylesterase type B